MESKPPKRNSADQGAAPKSQHPHHNKPAPFQQERIYWQAYLQCKAAFNLEPTAINRLILMFFSAYRSGASPEALVRIFAVLEAMEAHGFFSKVQA